MIETRTEIVRRNLGTECLTIRRKTMNIFFHSNFPFLFESYFAFGSMMLNVYH